MADPQEPTIVESDTTPKYMAPAEPAGPPSGDEAAALKRQIELEKQQKEAIDQRAEISKKELQSLEEQKTATDPLYKEALGTAKEREKVLAETPVPDVPVIPPPPNQAPISKNTAELMGSIGLMISAIAGFGGRVNGIKMNQALAGFLTGYRDARYADAEFARRQWHDTFEYQIALYKMQVERQREILGRSGMKLENKLAEIELTMAPYRDYQEGLEVRDRSLATVLSDLRQEEQLIERLESLRQRVHHDELRNTIDVQKYNLEVWKAMHPNALHPTAEQDKLALALKQLGLPANTPIDKLTADQAKKVNELIKTAARTTTTGPAAPTTKAYQEMVQTAAQREYKRLEPVVRRDLQAQGTRAHANVKDETIKRVDKWLRENYKYKIVGASPGVLYGINLDVAPLRKEEDASSPEPSTATEWRYNSAGELVPAGE